MKRLVIWLNSKTCEGVDQHGHKVLPVAQGRRVSVADYLRTADAHDDAEHVTVYLTGPRPTPAKGGKVSDWLLAPTGEFLPGEHYMDADRPVGRFTGGSKLYPRAFEIRRAAELFGECDDPRIARDAWETFCSAWSRVWPMPALMSQVANGRIALAQCGAVEWPPTETETAELIRSVTPQHRIELCRPNLDPWTVDHAATMPGFVYLDARWSYIALLSELRVGEPARCGGDTANDYSITHPYARGLYRVAYQAPRTWSHIGILLGKDGGGWRAAPMGETWCDATELFVARQHGWTVTVKEAMIWPERRGASRALDRWRDKMLRVAGHCASDPIAGYHEIMAANVVRTILLQTIGAFHSYTARNVVYVDTASQVPAELRETMEPRGTGWTYVKPVPMSKLAAMFTHPEITAQIWGRGRARILDHRAGDFMAGALYVDPKDLVAIHGDALYLTRNPGWPDDGKIGRMRLKGTLPGPLAWPDTLHDVYSLAHKAEAATK